MLSSQKITGFLKRFSNLVLRVVDTNQRQGREGDCKWVEKTESVGVRSGQRRYGQYKKTSHSELQSTALTMFAVCDLALSWSRISWLCLSCFSNSLVDLMQLSRINAPTYFVVCRKRCLFSDLFANPPSANDNLFLMKIRSDHGLHLLSWSHSFHSLAYVALSFCVHLRNLLCNGCGYSLSFRPISELFSNPPSSFESVFRKSSG